MRRDKSAGRQRKGSSDAFRRSCNKRDAIGCLLFLPTPAAKCDVLPSRTMDGWGKNNFSSPLSKTMQTNSIAALFVSTSFRRSPRCKSSNLHDLLPPLAFACNCPRRLLTTRLIFLAWRRPPLSFPHSSSPPLSSRALYTWQINTHAPLVPGWENKGGNSSL